jgi:MFS family permease
MGSSKPVGLKWRSSTSFIITTVAMSLFTDLFLYGLVVPTLPFLLEDRVRVPSYQIQGYTSALLAIYAASSVLFSPLAGYFADKISTRRLPFLVGLSALIGSTALFAVGQTVLVLVVARILQGISAAVVWTIGLALVYDTVGSANLGKTIGSVSPDGCHERMRI